MSTDPRLLELFGQAVELPTAERAGWLAELASREPVLANEIADLLAASARRGTVLDAPVPQPFPEPAPPGPSLPERIGPFTILRELGRGGMGRVFLAEETGEHFRRRVALKVLDRGDLDPAAVRRFRDEVRILASLEHPGIARFLDGGQTADGTWYLALEYVEGVTLVEHARVRHLDARELVALFLAVLEAVAHAHARNVVHRDLKPSNILVGADERPRLLDFGISKLLDETEGDSTLTRTELRAFTPAYASPEQFRGEPATAASDVYSLGVVLYELLAGARPYRTDSSSRAALERAVLEEDPEPPSTAARRAASHDHGDAAAAERPAPRLGRDLDAICLKALRKEPGERYASVVDFASDLRRYLGGLSVAARRGGRRYRAGRWLARHRMGVATAGAMAVAAAALVTAFTVNRASPPPALVSPSPAAPRPFPFSAVSSPPVEELERRFAAAPASVEAGAALALVLNRDRRTDEAMLVVGRLRQIPDKGTDPLIDYVEGSLASAKGQPQRALVLQTRALEGALATGRGELVAQIRATRGHLLDGLGRSEEARREMELARSDFERAGDLASLARVDNDLAVEQMRLGHLAEGERLFAAALAATRQLSPANRGATFLLNLGIAARVRGRPDIAEPRLREAIAAFGEQGRPTRLALPLAELSVALAELARPTEGRAALTRSIGLLRGADAPALLANSLFYDASMDVDAGRLAGVEGRAAEIEALAQKTGDRSSLAFAEDLRGRLAGERGQLAAARRLLAEASRLFATNGDPVASSEVDLLHANLERSSGDPAEARRLLAGIVGASTARESAFYASAEASLAALDAREGRVEEARRRLDALGPAVDASTSVRVRLALHAARAALARGEKRHAAARGELEAAVELTGAAALKLVELELRLDLAELAAASGDATAAESLRRGVEREATRLGLLRLVTLARRGARPQAASRLSTLSRREMGPERAAPRRAGEPRGDGDQEQNGEELAAAAIRAASDLIPQRRKLGAISRAASSSRECRLTSLPRFAGAQSTADRRGSIDGGCGASLRGDSA